MYDNTKEWLTDLSICGASCDKCVMICPNPVKSLCVQYREKPPVFESVDGKFDYYLSSQSVRDDREYWKERE